MSKHQNQDRKSASVVMINTSCEKVSQIDTSVHLLMNIFSAALLGATNFAMQAWAAPTRADVEQIHESGGTADIGIISMSNVFHIRPKRLIMWTIMLVTALPLHLVYNSAISSTTSRPSYNVVVVSPETKASSYGGVVLVADQKSTRATKNKTSEPASGILYQGIVKASLFSDLGADWMREITVMRKSSEDPGAYKDPRWETEERQNIFAFTKDVFSQEYLMQVDRQGFFWGQLCYFDMDLPTPEDAHCYFEDYLATTNRSSPSTPVFRVRGKMFVRRIDPKCRLLAEPVFWWLTTICNLVIAACLSSMAWFYRSAPLVTIGDAIDSFITEPPSPDSKMIPRSSCIYHHPSLTNIFRPALPPRAYKPKVKPLWKSVSLTRWSLTMAWFIGLLPQCLLSFVFALCTDDIDTPAQWLASLSIFDPNNSLDFNHILYHNNGSDRLVLLANTPQIFLSLTYLFFNNILTKTTDGTSNTSAKEKKTCQIVWWKRKEKPSPKPTITTKTLRTSQPRGSQRSTFFLSLPYRYALPFVAVSSVMHWLTSQCLYFTEVDFIDVDGTTMDKSNPTTFTLGYSICAMFWVIVLGTLSWITILGLAVFGKYPAGMPIMGGCSAVIAAACHAPLRRKKARREREGENGDGDGDGDEDEEEGDTDIAAGPLSWGVIRQVVVRDGVEVEEKWLGFTRGEAERPVVGEVYV
ncbi:hypothetical protein QR685DRAFT_601498 [Neurospora intermedia]|uniref:DUF6536 domain-containing protein n=1 Tax=Neurospora intermedia TaxID=5142 RepID=A0ABR3CXV7_NEUIN